MTHWKRLYTQTLGYHHSGHIFVIILQQSRLYVYSLNTTVGYITNKLFHFLKEKKLHLPLEAKQAEIVKREKTLNPI